MKWRDVIITSIITLLITILGGIAVWFLTREPMPAPPVEKLVYAVESAGSLTVEQTRITFTTVRLINLGNKAARDVRIVISVADGGEIVERQIASSVGAAARLSDESKDKRNLYVSVAALAPDEIITASLLVRGSGTPDPQVSVRSADSIGRAGSIFSQPTAAPEKAGITAPIILSLLATALAAQGILMVLLRGPLTRFVSSVIPSPNNTAFVLLHQGLTEPAAHILARALERSGGTSYELANMGLVKTLQGDGEMAGRYFTAAEWWTKSKHAMAVIAFNRATAALVGNDFVAARGYLSSAIKMNRTNIIKYCDLRVYMQAAIKVDAEMRQIVSKKKTSNRFGEQDLKREAP